MDKKSSRLFILIVFFIMAILTLELPNAAAAVPTDWRAGVPEPVLANHAGWINFYYDTWRIADLKKQSRPTRSCPTRNAISGFCWISTSVTRCEPCSTMNVTSGWPANPLRK